MASDEVSDAIWEKLKVKYAKKEEQIGVEAMRTYERIIMLNIIDAQWKDHLLSLDHLKQDIGLVGYGQKDPLVEYKKQSFDLFQEMLAHRYQHNPIALQSSGGLRRTSRGAAPAPPAASLDKRLSRPTAGRWSGAPNSHPSPGPRGHRSQA